MHFLDRTVNYSLLLILFLIVVSLENIVASSEVIKDGVLQACHTTEKCSQGKFLTVAELSSAADRSTGLAAAIDMVYNGRDKPFIICLFTF